LAAPLSSAPGPEAERRLPGFLAAFGFRNYRLLWTGAFLSSIGTWTQDVALSWLIHTRLGDPFYLGLRQFAADFPLIAFMLVGGAVADRVDRRRILLTSQHVQMALAVVLGVLYATGRLGIAAILLVAFLTGLAQSQSAPTYQAVITSLVPPPQIPNAVALNSLQFNLSRAIGPAIAAVVLARAGTGWCFAANALSFVAVIVALWRIDFPPPATSHGGQTLAESLRAGLGQVFGSPVLSALTLLGAAGSFLGFPLITYLPVIAGDVLKTGAPGYSLLLSSFGLGAILGAVVTAHRGKAAGRGRILFASFTAYGLATIGAVASRHPPLSMALLFVSGTSIVSAFSTLNSLVQENATDAFRGRVMSIFGLAFRGGGPLGGLLAGLLVKHLGAPVTIGAYSVLLVLFSLAVPLRSSRVRDL
jgi:predicted MFS family arabinose efflux permease